MILLDRFSEMSQIPRLRRIRTIAALFFLVAMTGAELSLLPQSVVRAEEKPESPAESTSQPAPREFRPGETVWRTWEGSVANVDVAGQPRPRAIFTGAGPGAWDAKIRERGWIVRDEALWRMWYTGYDGTKEGVRRLGLAVSTDGFSWTRHPANPLLPDTYVEDVCVWRDAESDLPWLMVAEGKQDQAQWLSSPDGRTWKREGQLDVRLTNGQPIEAGPYGTPTIFHDRELWYLFYERRDLGIWLATSSDLKQWRNVQDEPVISPGPGEYDRQMIALNQVVRIGDQYVAVLHGSSGEGMPKLWTTYFATSTDLKSWTKETRSPVFPAAANRSSGQLVYDGRQWRLYTFHDRVELHFPVE